MFHCDLSLNIWCVCVCVCVCVCMCFYLFPTVLSVSAPFLPSLIASNQLIYDFCKWVIFEEKRQCYHWKCLIATVTTWQIVLIYIYMDVSIYWPMCVLCVFVRICTFCVCLWYQIGVSAKNHTVSDLSKHDASLYEIHTKVLLVLRFQGLTCIDPSYH